MLYSIRVHIYPSLPVSCIEGCQWCRGPGSATYVPGTDTVSVPSASIKPPPHVMSLGVLVLNVLTENIGADVPFGNEADMERRNATPA